MPLSVRVEAGVPCWSQAARKVSRTAGPTLGEFLSRRERGSNAASPSGLVAGQQR
jgi:hypothetical protein